ncbi:MAG TPA: integrase, partial [Burkholderiaceae bacterium]|nr:integrase [Burkholderiaceae bacterium]
MPPLTPALVAQLAPLAREAAAAPHGQRGALVRAAAEQLGMSVATVHRHLHAVSVRAPRKRRDDAGRVYLALQEAEVIAAWFARQQNALGKRGAGLADCLMDLRRSGLVRAEWVNPATGEVRPLSTSAVMRALRHYKLHPDQLAQPTLAVAQKSPHPNHTWQLDASLCTLFYLADDGSAPMPERVFYKNRLDNFAKVARQRVTRFVACDHTSGALRVRYFLGGESEANWLEFILWAFQKHGGDPIHGVPWQVMVDPGSGLTAGIKNMLERLLVRVITNAPGNPRAKGAVESAQRIWERGFERQFHAHRPEGLADLNERAQVYARWLNSEKEHSRHGASRLQKWQEITPGQLRAAPPLDLCRQLLTARPVQALVDVYGRVKFGGADRRWRVSHVPGATPGTKISVTFNPYNDAEIFAVTIGQDGHELLLACPLVELDAHGFAQDAREIGTGYRALADTEQDKARKTVERIATGANTPAEAARAARDPKREVLGGQLRFGYLKDDLDAQPARVPRATTPLQAPALRGAEPPAPRVLSRFEAARVLAERGLDMTAQRHEQIRQWPPQGAPESELDSLAHRRDARPPLRLASG